MSFQCTHDVENDSSMRIRMATLKEITPTWENEPSWIRIHCEGTTCEAAWHLSSCLVTKRFPQTEQLNGFSPKCILRVCFKTSPEYTDWYGGNGQCPQKNRATWLPGVRPRHIRWSGRHNSTVCAQRRPDNRWHSRSPPKSFELILYLRGSFCTKRILLY